MDMLTAQLAAVLLAVLWLAGIASEALAAERRAQKDREEARRHFESLHDHNRS